MKIHNYKYKCFDAKDKKIKGTLQAPSENLAKVILTEKGYKKINVTKHDSMLATLNTITVGKTISDSNLVIYLKELGALLSSGMYIVDACETMAFSIENRLIQNILLQIYFDVYNGTLFSDALLKFKKEFPDLLVYNIKSAEETGTLPQTINAMGEYYYTQLELKKTIRSAMFTPLMYFILLIGVTWFLVNQVMPTIASMYSSADADLFFATKWLIAFGDFWSIYGNFIVIVLISIFIGFNLIINTHKKIKKTYHKIILNIPVVKNMSKANNQVIIAITMNQLLSRGVFTIDALNICKGAVKNLYYRDLLQETINNIESGLTFNKSFDESKYIDKVMSKMISSGEKSGDLPKMFNELAIYYNSTMIEKMQGISKALNQTLLIIVYSILFFLIMAVMLPTFDFAGQVT